MGAILVTGGLGYAGRHIVGMLDRAERKVVSYNRDYSEVATGNVVSVQGELFDIPRLVKTMRDHEVAGIIHTAAMSHPDLSIELPLTTVAANIDGTVHLLEACRLADVRRLVNFSSETVYGHVDGPVTEASSLTPTTPYGVTKVATELFGRVYGELYGMQVLSLRVSEVYGPGNRMPQILRDMTKAALRHGSFSLPNGGDHGFHFIHVTDVARASILAVDARDPHGHVFNICGGPQVTMRQAADMVRSLLPQATIGIGPGHWHLDRQGQWSMERAERELGYRPAITLAEGLAAYVDWLRTHED
ncbi:MAG: NAD(P)-dependent oxidoreductase [Dongiaceae bacterium]